MGEVKYNFLVNKKARLSPGKYLHKRRGILMQSSNDAVIARSKQCIVSNGHTIILQFMTRQMQLNFHGNRNMDGITNLVTFMIP